MNDELTPSERAALRARIVGAAHDIKPVGAHRSAWVAGSLAAVLVVAIAGGVAATSTLSAPEIANTPTPSATQTIAPSPTPSLAPSPSATPTPTSTARVVTQPTSRFSFGCDAIASKVGAIFGGEAPASVKALPQPRGNAWVSGPIQYAFAQAGDLSCEYDGADGTYAQVVVIADGQGALDDRNSFSGGTCDPQYPPCELVAGTFILVESYSATGLSLDGEEAAVWNEVRDLVSASPPSPKTWTPPTGSGRFPADCAALLPADRLAATLGLEQMQIKTEGRGGWSAWYWLVSDIWQAPPCVARSATGNPYDDPSTLALVWLPGGEWAFDNGASGDPLSFDGSRDEDRAVLSCSTIETTEVCHADLLLDASWIRFSLPQMVAPADRMTAASAIASIMAESVYG
jgi:hypothetical protein